MVFSPSLRETGVMDDRIIRFEGRGAQVQYRVLMALYSIVFNRWLYGIFCRALARFFDPDNKVVLDLGDGRAFRIYLNDGYWTRFYLYHRDYEPEVRAVLDAARGHTGLFCDLGANSGLWSVYASALFDQVLSIEAAGKTFGRLSENMADLPGVEARRAAIFERSGETLRFVNVHQSHASAHLALDRGAGTHDTVEEVETVCIDDLVGEGIAALIKLDVEGAEIAAINGANRVIEEGGVFIYEDHGSDLNSEVTRHFMALDGMAVFAIEEAPKKVSNTGDLVHIKTDRYKGYNFLAGREDSALMAAIIDGFANRDAGAKPDTAETGET
ncbi:MAG: FkbM family methyltransferase [Pseudomonadota bacterium]